MAEALARTIDWRSADTGLPAAVAARWPAVMRISSAVLIGFGIILFVAANWTELSRASRFGLIGAALAAAVVISFMPRLRVPGLVAAFLASGGLLALIGQTYQTGADEWQLFAVCAALTLPFALAARHDALWTCWALVAMTALALLQTQSLTQLGRASDLKTLAIVWSLALLIAVVLSPWPPKAHWRGSTTWAFRLVVLLAIALIVRDGARELFSGSGVVYVVGLLLLVVFVALLSKVEPLDLGLAAAAALGVDILAILGVSYWLLKSADVGSIGIVFVIGLLSAGIVAATGAGLLSIARSHGRSAPTWRGAWPVTLLTGLGALIAAVPLLAGLALLFGNFINGPAIHVLSLVVLAGSAMMVRGSQAAHFSHMFGVIGLVAGLTLAALGISRDTGESVLVLAPIMIGVVGVVALVVGRTWVQAILGAAVAVLLALWIAGALTDNAALSFRRLAFGPVLVLACLVPLARALENVTGFKARLGETAELFLSGALGAALLGVVVWSGPSMLVGATFGSGPRWDVPASALLPGWTGISLGSLSAAVAGAGLLVWRRPDLASTRGLATLGAITIVSAFVPSLGYVALLAAAALLTDSRRWLMAAAIAGIWLVGAFYYKVTWPLMAKAALMTTVGLALGAFAWRNRADAARDGSVAASFTPTWVAHSLIVLGALAVAGTAGYAIARSENLIATGRRIYIALAPRDPRSLIQGDYMALAFALPAARPTTPPGSAPAFWAIARVDARGVAIVERIATERAAPNGAQISLPLRIKSHGWVLVTDAWYFREGTGATWSRARFGEFRIDGSGRALLVGLADEALVPIRP